MFLEIYKDLEDSKLFNFYLKEIIHRVYEMVMTKEVVKRQKQMNKEEQQKLNDVLDKFCILFDDKLGHYPQNKFCIDVKQYMRPMQ